MIFKSFSISSSSYFCCFFHSSTNCLPFLRKALLTAFKTAFLMNVESLTVFVSYALMMNAFSVGVRLSYSFFEYPKLTAKKAKSSYSLYGLCSCGSLFSFLKYSGSKSLNGIKKGSLFQVLQIQVLQRQNSRFA